MSSVIVNITAPPAVSVTTSPPASVRVVAGPAALVGTGAFVGYQFTQGVPSAVWTINHNLGFNPVVQTFSTGGEEIEGAVIHLTPNTTQVSFAAPIAGTARAI